MTPIPSVDLVPSKSSESNSQVLSPNTDDAAAVETNAATAATDSVSKTSRNDKMNTTTTAGVAKNEESDLSKSEAVRRARSHWQFVKSVVATHTAPRGNFKTGVSVSLTTAEATFLTMITQSALDADHDSGRARGGMARFKHADGGGVGGGPPKVSGGTQFAHLVQAAMAKERLRDAISARLVNLSTAETKFLTKLVANKNVSLDALQNAVEVLNNDPLYNPKLRREDSEFISDFNVGGIGDEKEGDSPEDDGDDDDERRIRASAAQVSSRTLTGRKSVAFHDKAVAGRAGAAAVGRTAPRHRRRASVAEASIWGLARGAAKEVAGGGEARGDEAPPPPPPPPAMAPARFGLSQPGEEVDVLSESVRGREHENMLDSSVHRTPRGGRSRHRAGAGRGIGAGTGVFGGAGVGGGSIGGGGAGEVGGGEVGLDASTRTSRRRGGLDASARRFARGGGSLGSGPGVEAAAGGEVGLDASTRTSRRASRGRFARGGSVGSQAVGGGEVGLDASTRSHRRAGSGGALDASARALRGGRARAGTMPLDSSARHRRAGTMPLDASARSRRATEEEKSMWKLVHGESIEVVDDDDSNAVLEDKDTGLPVKTVKAGEAMDPLLMACPIERSPMPSDNKIKMLEPPAGHAGDFLSQSVRIRGRSTMVEGDALSKSVRTISSRRGSGSGALPMTSLPMTSLRRFHTADNPLPVPSTPNNDQKEGLDDFLSSSQRTRRHKRFSSLGQMPPMPAVHETHHDDADHPEEKQPEEKQEEDKDNVSFVESEASKDASNPLAACLCGIDGMSLMENFMTTDDATAEEKKEKPPGAKTKEEDELASKKRYLHLDDHGPEARNDPEAEEDERRTKLSTWMGAPEDYPILGLDAKRSSWEDDGEGENEALGDPLEPHVLSPLLMKSLRDHLPYALREENFWLRYSLVRDGASLDVIFDALRHSQHTVLAIETSRGDVLGSFTSSPWRANGNRYYGSCEAFVWNLRKSRLDEAGEDSSRSLDEYILRESSLDVFAWNAREGNRNVQLSNKRKLFVGGGEPEAKDGGMQNGVGGGGESKEDSSQLQWGMALALDKELLHGTSSRCTTFASDPLIGREGSDVFEIMNMEIWALTPCMNEEMAEELELGRTFVMGFHGHASESSFQ